MRAAAKLDYPRVRCGGYIQIDLSIGKPGAVSRKLDLSVVILEAVS